MKTGDGCATVTSDKLPCRKAKPLDMRVWEGGSEANSLKSGYRAGRARPKPVSILQLPSPVAAPFGYKVPLRPQAEDEASPVRECGLDTSFAVHRFKRWTACLHSRVVGDEGSFFGTFLSRHWSPDRPSRHGSRHVVT